MIESFFGSGAKPNIISMGKKYFVGDPTLPRDAAVYVIQLADIRPEQVEKEKAELNKLSQDGKAGEHLTSLMIILFSYFEQISKRTNEAEKGAGKEFEGQGTNAILLIQDAKRNAKKRVLEEVPLSLRPLMGLYEGTDGAVSYFVQYFVLHLFSSIAKETKKPFAVEKDLLVGVAENILDSVFTYLEKVDSTDPKSACLNCEQFVGPYYEAIYQSIPSLGIRDGIVSLGKDKIRKILIDLLLPTFETYGGFNKLAKRKDTQLNEQLEGSVKECQLLLKNIAKTQMEQLPVRLNIMFEGLMAPFKEDERASFYAERDFFTGIIGSLITHLLEDKKGRIKKLLRAFLTSFVYPDGTRKETVFERIFLLTKELFPVSLRNKQTGYEEVSQKFSDSKATPYELARYFTAMVVTDAITKLEAEKEKLRRANPALMATPDKTTQAKENSSVIRSAAEATQPTQSREEYEKKRSELENRIDELKTKRDYFAKDRLPEYVMKREDFEALPVEERQKQLLTRMVHVLMPRVEGELNYGILLECALQEKDPEKSRKALRQLSYQHLSVDSCHEMIDKIVKKWRDSKLFTKEVCEYVQTKLHAYVFATGMTELVGALGYDMILLKPAFVTHKTEAMEEMGEKSAALQLLIKEGVSYLLQSLQGTLENEVVVPALVKGAAAIEHPDGSLYVKTMAEFAAFLLVTDILKARSGNTFDDKLESILSSIFSILNSSFKELDLLRSEEIGLTENLKVLAQNIRGAKNSEVETVKDEFIKHYCVGEQFLTSKDVGTFCTSLLRESEKSELHITKLVSELMQPKKEAVLKKCGADLVGEFLTQEIINKNMPKLIKVLGVAELKDIQEIVGALLVKELIPAYESIHQILHVEPVHEEQKTVEQFILQIIRDNISTLEQLKVDNDLSQAGVQLGLRGAMQLMNKTLQSPQTEPKNLDGRVLFGLIRRFVGNLIQNGPSLFTNPHFYPHLLVTAMQSLSKYMKSGLSLTEKERENLSTPKVAAEIKKQMVNYLCPEGIDSLPLPPQLVQEQSELWTHLEKRLQEPELDAAKLTNALLAYFYPKGIDSLSAPSNISAVEKAKLWDDVKKRLQEKVVAETLSLNTPEKRRGFLLHCLADYVDSISSEGALDRSQYGHLTTQEMDLEIVRLQIKKNKIELWSSLNSLLQDAIVTQMSQFDTVKGRKLFLLNNLKAHVDSLNSPAEIERAFADIDSETEWYVNQAVALHIKALFPTKGHWGWMQLCQWVEWLLILLAQWYAAALYRGIKKVLEKPDADLFLRKLMLDAVCLIPKTHFDPNREAEMQEAYKQLTGELGLFYAYSPLKWVTSHFLTSDTLFPGRGDGFTLLKNFV